jgi:hypothetical protein
MVQLIWRFRQCRWKKGFATWTAGNKTVKLSFSSDVMLLYNKLDRLMLSDNLSFYPSFKTLNNKLD